MKATIGLVKVGLTQNKTCHYSYIATKRIFFVQMITYRFMVLKIQTCWRCKVDECSNGVTHIGYVLSFLHISKCERNIWTYFFFVTFYFKKDLKHHFLYYASPTWEIQNYSWFWIKCHHTFNEYELNDFNIKQ